MSAINGPPKASHDPYAQKAATVWDNDPRLSGGPSLQLFRAYLNEFEVTGSVRHLGNRSHIGMRESALVTVERFDTTGALKPMVDRLLDNPEHQGGEMMPNLREVAARVRETLAGRIAGAQSDASASGTGLDPEPGLHGSRDRNDF
jgi:hypothetical protein